LLRLLATGDNAVMQTEPGKGDVAKTDPPKRKRRWFQFSLRTLIVVMAIVAVQCAVCLPMLREWKERDEYRRELVRRTIHFMSASPRAQGPTIKAALTWLRRRSD
jgi:hypothetical protein